MSLSKESIEKLRTIARQIQEQPEFYAQTESPTFIHRNHCNSPCCIAGYAIWNEVGPKRYSKVMEIISTDGNIILKMADALGIEPSQADILFSSWSWHKPEFKDALFKEGTPTAAKAAHRRIEHFIATNGAE